MHNHTLRLLGLLACLSLMLIAAGCFQPAGAGLEATNVAFSAPTLAVESIESPTPEPSLTPTEDLLPIESLETPTPDGIALDTAEITPTTADSTLDVFEVAQLPSETPTPDPQLTIDAAATELAATQTAAVTTTPDEMATFNAFSTELAATQTAAVVTPTPDELATLNAMSTEFAATQTAAVTTTPDEMATFNAFSTELAATQTAAVVTLTPDAVNPTATLSAGVAAPDDLATFNAVSTEIAATQTAAVATATPDEVATLIIQATLMAQTQAALTAGAPLPFETPTPTPTPDFLATFDAQSTLSAGTQVAALPAAQDDLAGTATALAIQVFGLDPNLAQPTPEPAQLDPGFQTATAAVLQSTQAVAAQLTQTQLAIIGQFVTPSPTFDFSILTPQDPGGGAGGAFTSTPTVSIPSQPSGTCLYVVQRGDNLFRISLRFNTTVHEIAALSGVANINLILVGQELTIPNCGGSTVTSTHAVTFAPPPPAGCAQYYRVRQNDTLFRISLTYGTTVNNLAAANPQINNINLIYIDQEICIP